MSHSFDSLDKIQKFLTIIIRVSLLVAIIEEILNREWLLLLITIFIFVLTYSYKFVEHKYRFRIPIEYELIILIFIYATLFLGELRGFYTLFWWWDIVLHIGSGLALGFSGFLIMYILYYKNKINASPFLVSIFAFCFALAIGAIWEIFEFSADQILGTSMQKSGLIDTMWDLIIDAGGALITSIMGYLYLKGTKTPLFTRMVSKYIKENRYFTLKSRTASKTL